jgi:hypothetical protein
LYSFVQTHADHYPVQVLCRVLGVSRSAYYSWKQHKEELAAGENKKGIEQQVISVCKEHRRRYGARRIAAALKANEVKAGVYKVGKVLKAHGLKAIHPRSFAVQRQLIAVTLIQSVLTCCWRGCCHKDQMRCG